MGHSCVRLHTYLSYIVRFKYTVGVSVVLKVMLDMRNESE